MLAQMINEISSNIVASHECVELIFKLNDQIQQLELYIVNYAYFLLCSAGGEMGKMQSLAQSREAPVCCEWLFCERAWLGKGTDCEPVAC